jgi:peptide/nickel transport system substrate-binding protein
MYGGIFKLPLTVGPATPLGYPWEAAPDASALAAHALETLIRVTLAGVVEPELATSWEVDPVGLTMTFHLRQGVKFHDGSDFDAHDVVWCFEKVMAAGRARDFESVTAVDDYTIQIKVTRYTNVTLTGLAGGYFLIISTAAVEANGEDWARNNPVGTGAFKFVEYERDSRLVFERNDEYWDEGIPYLDGLEYVVISDDTVRKLAFQRGDIHRLVATGIDAQELQSEGYTMRSQTGGTMVLIPDSANPDSPFADIRVRQAVSYAINREALVSGLTYGFGHPAYQIYPGFEVSGIPDLDITEYNPDKARTLLTVAGYPNGFSTSIHAFTRVVPRDYITAIAAMLNEVGIQTEPDFPEAGKYTEYRFGGWSNSMMGHGLINFTNPNQVWGFYFNPAIAFPSMKMPQVLQDAIDASLASIEPDPALVQAALRIVAEEMISIPYIEEVIAVFYRDGVHDPGADIYPSAVFQGNLAWLEPQVR